VHGALLAALAAGARGAPPIMHARSLNPYVAAAIADWRRSDKMKCFWAELLLSGRVVLEKGV